MSDVTFTCDQCGAAVYAEHIQSGIARRQAGRLLCAFCLQESGAPAGRATAVDDDELAEPINFDPDDADQKSASTASAFVTTNPAIGGGRWDDSQFKRPLAPNAAGATRCRIFHSKLNDGALAFMTEQVNHWLDGNPEITVKATTSTIGVFEGKHSDPNLILTVFY